MKLQKKRLTATRTRECENNIILQGTAKRAWLKEGPVRVAHERMLEVLGNDSTRRIPHVKHAECVPSPKISAPPLPSKSTSTARVKKTSVVYSSCKSSRLIENLLLPTSPRTRRRRIGAQLKPRATTMKADLASLRLHTWTK